MAFLPEKDRDYLSSKGIPFEEHEESGVKAIVLKEFPLPEGRFDAAAVDVLVLLPPGYPDAPPDMFYLLPWVKFAADQRYPNAANQPHSFLTQQWQRWSRHCSEWRPGADGIWTMVTRIRTAIQEAK